MNRCWEPTREAWGPLAQGRDGGSAVIIPGQGLCFFLQPSWGSFFKTDTLEPIPRGLSSGHLPGGLGPGCVPAGHQCPHPLLHLSGHILC